MSHIVPLLTYAKDIKLICEIQVPILPSRKGANIEDSTIPPSANSGVKDGKGRGGRGTPRSLQQPGFSHLRPNNMNFCIRLHFAIN